MAISNIDNRGSWYDIYDERGKKGKTLSSNIGTIEGFSSDFFVANRGSLVLLHLLGHLVKGNIEKSLTC